MLGKTFKGMTDEMLEWQTAKLLELETRRDGHVVHVRPELVVEVAFNGIQASPTYPGGLALRFARIVRYRPDKGPDQSDTIETVRELHRRVVVAQSAGGVPGDTAPFALQSASLVAGAAPVTARRAALLGRRGSIAARFDGMLHERERSRHAIARTSAVRPSAAGTGVAAVTPPTLGSLRTFTVCASLDCTTYKPVTARAQSVGAHVAIYVDTAAPANGLTATDIDTLQQVFDTHVYVVDTTAFGSVSDIDSNGVVITLMTPVVNSLVTNAECQAGGFVAGFADPADLDPSTAVQHNQGEIFYTVVADPNGALSS